LVRYKYRIELETSQPSFSNVNATQVNYRRKTGMNPQPGGNASPQATDLARMEAIFALQREAYARSPMPTLAERKRNLAALRALLIDHTDAIAQAISDDFTARSVDDTLLGEIIPSVHSIDYSQKRLRGWMKPSPRSVGLNLLPARARVVYQPLGVVGIMVPFNYPREPGRGAAGGSAGGWQPDDD